jgi:uncharacterized protein (TIGR00251 family)
LSVAVTHGKADHAVKKAAMSRFEEALLTVRVVPRASRNAVQSVAATGVKIRLTAPPVDGKANAALIEFLAEALDVPRSACTLVAGATARDKRVAVRGLTNAEALRRLNSATA